LPDALTSTVAKRMRVAYHLADPLLAEAELEALARSLDRSHPGAAASLREGLAETLTIARLGVPPTLARTLRSTNSIESMIEICRDHAANVKRWQDGQMVLRWVAAGMGEAAKQFRRVNGHLHLPALRAALDQTIPAHVTHPPRRMPPDHRRAATEIPRNTGQARSSLWAGSASTLLPAAGALRPDATVLLCIRVSTAGHGRWRVPLRRVSVHPEGDAEVPPGGRCRFLPGCVVLEAAHL